MEFLFRPFRKAKRSRFICETCGAPLVCRTSWIEHLFMRRELYQCDFVPCSQSYWGRTELTHCAAQSGLPEAKPSALPMQTRDYVAMAQKVYEHNQRLAQAKNEHQLDLLDAVPNHPPRHAKEDLAS
ncbi:hypothetical protein QE393_001659 [Pseudomonas sp. SORGH_AS 211]|uniref:hypothetical protein n=1 Tax=Pseudomonas sp. SORGH_AS_0211 TaxID=3041796 RepID=UPI00285CF7C8|nr:hypothetical protein [Pseudomonas sp. SORGH_AS_0211]MDR6178399.1 hypothetical protein [Pseudomonas sp. SORGH_AS_0211]